MDVTPQRTIAAEIMKCGVNRIWISQDHLSDVSVALTRDDVKKLILDGIIRKKQIKGVSRGRARLRQEKKQRGQRKGTGRRQGAKFSRIGKKERWINRIRPQRRFLKALRDKELLSKHNYRKTYRQAKGGQFRSVAYLRSQLQESDMIKAKPSVAERARRRS
ncbi:MAG: 50S ribosomal protein L19e [Candidatus Hodarchaeales archaeon]|jgi:large subunit ribosomal protein L19e